MHKLFKLLEELGIADQESLMVYNHGVRDNKNINVLKCKKSGIIILDKISPNQQYYEENIDYSEDTTNTFTTNKVVSSKLLDDDVRRFEQNKSQFKGKSVLDFGCGKGEFIKLIDKITAKTVGVELNNINRKNLISNGYDIRNDINQLNNNEKFDYIILNHVFEHLDEPIQIMNKLKKHLKLNGEIIIEIPHARDFLHNTLDIEEFKSFTFWSEHLILHTKKSLELFLKHCGFSTKKIIGYQRYPISNHIYWISEGKPGGHEMLNFMNKDYLIESYNKFLTERDETDTIIGYFKH